MTWSRQVEIDFTPVGNRREEQCVLDRLALCHRAGALRWLNSQTKLELE